ncbi:MAG: hypothetical protein ACSHXK_03680 [Oceanococcus sp.]
MLLYKDKKEHYVAVKAEYEFAACYGYQACFDGKDVPNIICEAYIREYGGFVIAEDFLAAA